MPEVLPDYWAEIARTEFVGVDELHPSGNTKLVRCFGRFRNLSPNRDNQLTEEDWLKAWRGWLLDDFPLSSKPEPGLDTSVIGGGSAPAGNGHDPPVDHDGHRDFERLLVLAYENLVRGDPRRLQVREDGGLFLEDKRLLRSRIRAIADGTKDPPFGIDGGPQWDWQEILDRCPEVKKFVHPSVIETTKAELRKHGK